MGNQIGLWFYELQTQNMKLGLRISRTLAQEKTPYQDLLVVDTLEYGRLLALDGAIQLTVSDEFIYHEMIAHVPLMAHEDPKSVLVVGGGDGGTVREIVKHLSVEHVDLVEIDERVLDVCRRFFPEISRSLSDPRVRVAVGDGIEFVKKATSQYDVIIIDSSDPIGPGVGLFEKEFYQGVFDALKPEGLFVAQTESPFSNRDLIQRVYASAKSIFPKAALYLAPIPTYPSGLWSFTTGSKVYDPISPARSMPDDIVCRYYTPEIHKAAFALPRFVKELIGEYAGAGNA
ncbi:MAG: polyamine aminopropyltransferase [Firmicutes bacterium]|nr:polyamine aminopropyltransferase [Bacillota bacterium]